jgi:hypothetical protein
MLRSNLDRGGHDLVQAQEASMAARMSAAKSERRSRGGRGGRGGRKEGPEEGCGIDRLQCLT